MDYNQVTESKNINNFIIMEEIEDNEQYQMKTIF